MTTAKLSVVKPGPTGPKPARKLGEHGMNLWRAIMSEYVIDDAVGIETLTSACQETDRAESLSEQIARDGELIQSERGMREHPALRHQLAARAFVARQLARLGLDVEPLKPIGRPPGGRR